MRWQSLVALSILLAISWTLALELQQSRDISLVGIGIEEYRRVVSATMWVFGLVTVVTVLFEVDMSRGYLLCALAFGLPGLLTGRHLVRKYLAKRRMQGEFIIRVVVLGKPECVQMLCASFNRSKEAGYRIVGACIPGFDGTVGEELVTQCGAIPILGDDVAVENALRLTSADALAVGAVEHLGHTKMRRLAWRLESLDIDLIVVPGLADIAGPRLLMRPIDNLPLLHIAPHRHDAPSAFAKRLFDLFVGTVALLMASPIMLLAAVAIMLDDGAPIIFRQERVGHRGRLFRIWKFRTMVKDAEARKSEALGYSGVFYKSASDSRITRVGRILRATSIDELPQLLNVIEGSMSIVGPRPLVPGEGESVEYFVERRVLVKPGITGLWQVSGRSNASEDERIRLDHAYVDNWSVVQDLMITWRTVRAVLKREGAM